MPKTDKNPYKEFTQWLYNSYPKAELAEWVIKSISPRAILSRYSNQGGITIFLNDLFNKYDLMSLDSLDFYYFIKDIVQKHKINQYDYSFFRSSRRDKTLSEIQKKLPHLKTNEIAKLLELCKNDPENESFLENLGLRKQDKVKKIKKKTRKTKKSSKKVLSISTFDDEMIRRIKTWEDWRACFSYEN